MTKRNFYETVVMITIFFLPLSSGFSQELGPLKISGEARVEFQYDHITGASQGRPEWIYTFSMTPQATVFGIPLDFLGNISSLDEAIRQPFNRLSLHFGKKWAEVYLGDAHPVYSGYSLNGILVRGASLDLHPGIPRIALCYGQTSRAIPGSKTVQPAYGQILYGGKLGLGKDEGSHIHFNFIQAKDDVDSIIPYYLENGTMSDSNPQAPELSGKDGLRRSPLLPYMSETYGSYSGNEMTLGSNPPLSPFSKGGTCGPLAKGGVCGLLTKRGTCGLIMKEEPYSLSEKGDFSGSSSLLYMGEYSQNSIELVTPKENTVASLNGQLNLFKDRFSIKGEIAASHLNRDARSARVEADEVPDFLEDIAKPRISSQAGFAYSLDSRFSASATSVDASYSFIDPGFSSLGTSYLQNDIQKIELAVNQGLWQNLISLSAGYDRFSDNLSGLKSFATVTDSFNFLFNLSPPNLPFLSISYMPYLQGNKETGELKMDSKTSIYSLNTGYWFHVLRMDHSMNMSYSFQNYRDKNPLVSDSNKYDVHSALFSATAGFAIPLSLSYGVGLTQSRYGAGMESDVWSYDAGISPRFFNDRLNTSLAISFYDETGDVDDQKFTLRMNGNYRWERVLDADLSIERISYNNKTDTNKDYDEFLVRLVLSKRW